MIQGMLPNQGILDFVGDLARRSSQLSYVKHTCRSVLFKYREFGMSGPIIIGLLDADADS